ncbi:uncharacterized protein LOC131949333 [Physella acuta]|uniref:uncharacterized protein LOC131949333 n=1 Tax=Physella acuta TaxID=109671 RepID=UPI0027DBADA9|nr:uncharacterized protein LOC131949333 [Physella acuta]
MATTASSASTKLTPTEWYVVSTMLSIFSVTGIIGNALAIYVFASLKQKLTSTIFILTLAGTDFITCLITIPFTLIIEYMEYSIDSDEFCKVYHFLITTTVPFSCVVIVAIAVDRYMCICHPFHHWMNIQRARIIIVCLVVIIFIIGGIVGAHHSIYNLTYVNDTSTFTPSLHTPKTFDITIGGTGMTFTPDPISPGPSYSQEVPMPARNRTQPSVAPVENTTVLINPIHAVYVKVPCDVNENLFNAGFFKVFKYMYTAIFVVSCVIVFALYALIYRSVIAQRKKKLHIKSAQCCLLWNAASVDQPHETAEMTQDIELSHVNGDERTRQNSATAEELETHNNGAVRKCSLSKARIERMRVANIKTALTLFIVTLVFILAFLPAWLMALEVIQMKVIVFYMHFVYNVANPFIYAFLNQNFKTELRRILRCGKQ